MTAVVLAGLIAALAGIGLVTGDDDSDETTEAAEPSVAEIARRVERIRQLEFERLPPVRHVSPPQARAFAMRALDRETKPSEVAAEERLLKLLELLPPDASLRSLLGKVFAGEVGGFYDPHNGTLAIVGGGSSDLLGEVTLAHELTHALEDQHFGLDVTPGRRFRRDLASAQTARDEGSATVVMLDYVVFKETGAKQVPASLRERALGALGDAAMPASSGLPRYLREGLVFPYAAGARLVSRIQDRGAWAAVDRAFGKRAPVSTEQVMHPAKYFAGERPVRIRVRPPSGTELVEQGDFGEFDTEQLLRAANGRALSTRAAAGWGGGGYALWRRGARFGVTLRWTWDSARDAREFARALRRTARRLGGRAEGTKLTLSTE